MEVLEKAIRLKDELDSYRPLKRDDEERIMQKFRLDWNYHSNNLEGNSLTYGETKALILFGITANGKPLRDHFEITGHNEAIKWVLEIIKEERPITENFIRELHKLILKESYEKDAITPDGKPTKRLIKVGEYKSTPNHVRTVTGEMFYFATPEETPSKMKDLVDWLRKEKKRKNVNPILLASEFHYRYIRIHPFDDGNGRTARILMNFILLQFDYPPVIIKTEDKDNYFIALRQADAGVLEAFIEYITINLVRSLEIMIKGAKGESIEDPDDIDKEIFLLKQDLKSLGEPVKITKTKEAILDVYDESITQVIEAFIEKNEAFTQLYLLSDFHVKLDGASQVHPLDKIILAIRSQLEKYKNKIQLIYVFQVLKQGSLKNFEFVSVITIEFRLSGYFIKSTNTELYKLYNEKLTLDEIDDLIDSERKRHLEVIKKQLKKVKGP